jgi:hypothetical protein
LRSVSAEAVPAVSAAISDPEMSLRSTHCPLRR